MGIRISAVIGWSEIFAGKFNSQTECELDLSQQYALIYADLTAGSRSGLDVLALLNDAFGTQLPQGKILVQDAGFFTFSHFGQGAIPANTTLASIFPQSPIPASVAGSTTPMDSTCGFWLSAKIQDVAIFGSLIQIGYDTSAGSGDVLALSAVLSKGTAAGTAVSQAAYTAQLPNFKLFNLFGFEQISISYQFITATHLRISGTVTAELFGHSYAFKGVLVSNGDARTVTGCIESAQPNTKIPALFGGAMTGIAFSDLVFGVYASTAPGGQTNVQVQGTVTVGSATLTGQIYLQGATPEVASIKVVQTLSIGDVFNQCIGAAVWPTSLIDLTFKAGSELYYCKAPSSAPLSLQTFSCPSAGSVPSAPAGNQHQLFTGFQHTGHFRYHTDRNHRAGRHHPDRLERRQRFDRPDRTHRHLHPDDRRAERQ
ncbi:MAG: hypothetical protein HC872_00200 [Gammaproteobacteria bacterium]|nr:hypothetical protein [Gammaproteobacteria bacterium]